MAETQTWRVVLATGEVREVRVTTEHVDGCPTEYSCGGECSLHSPHDAVMLWIGNAIWQSGGCLVAEILAPGEPTRAELVAQIATARREGAEEMRERASRVIRAHRKVRTDREEALRVDGVPQGDCAYMCLATAIVSLDRVRAEVDAIILGGDGGAR